MGIFLAIIAAVFDASRAACNKRCLQDLDELYLAWLTTSIGAIVLMLVAVLIGIPQLAPSFWPHFLITAVINSVTVVLTLKALRLGDLSLVAPIRSFSPFFLLFTSIFLLDEIPTPLGLLGILLIVFGSYIIEFRNIESGLLAPLKALYSNKAVQLMLSCTLLWSVSSCYAKLAILASSPLFFSAALVAFMALSLSVIVFSKRTARGRAFHPLAFFAGLLLLGEHLVTWTAFSFTFAVYVLSIKRLGLILSVLFGRVFFKEPRLLHRLTACAVMVGGAVLIAL